MTMEDRRAQDRHTPERRHNARRGTRVMGCALGLGALLIILFLLWPLVYA
jgi:hypothetical protein